MNNSTDSRLGSIESNVISILNRQTEILNKLDKNDDKISNIEKKQSKIVGLGVGIVSMIAFVSGVIKITGN